MMVLVEHIRRQWVLIPLLTITGWVAAPGHAVELYLESATVPAGATVSLELAALDGDDTPTALVLGLLFDGTRLALTDAQVNAGAAGAAIDFQNTDSGASVLMYGGSGPLSDSLATLEFSVQSTASAGERLPLSLGTASGANANAEGLLVHMEPATLTVSLPFTAHRADTDQNGQMSVGEILRLVQLYRGPGFSCDADGEDGYHPSEGPQNCSPHDSDYAPRDWRIDLSELLRAIQFYNAEDHRYHVDVASEDGFAPGTVGKSGALSGAADR